MNNSKLTIDGFTLQEDVQVDVRPHLRQQQESVVSVLEALEAVNRSQHWQTLQSKVFQESLGLLQKQIRNEKDPKELFRIQGKLNWGEKYTNLEDLILEYRRRLENIKNQIKQHG